MTRITTRQQLEAALAKGSGDLTIAADIGVIVIKSGRWTIRAANGFIPHVEVYGSSHVVAWGSSRIEAYDSSHVMARGSSSVKAWDSSRIEAWGSSRIEAYDSSHVMARDSSHVMARGSSRIEAWGSSRIEAYDSSHVMARDSSHVMARDNSSVVAYGSSRVVALGSSHVLARDNSSVEAWGSSHVLARDNSSVEAWGSSHVEAWGHSFLRLFGAKKVQAASGAVIMRHDKSVPVNGGTVIDAENPDTPNRWCEHWGVPVVDGVAVLFKCVDDDFATPRSRGKDIFYRPGETPSAPDWDGGKAECGGGLHMSPHPAMARTFHCGPRFVACPVLVDSIAVHPDGESPEKVKVPRVVAPIYEVDAKGEPV